MQWPPVERKGTCNVTRVLRHDNPNRFRACPRLGSSFPNGSRRPMPLGQCALVRDCRVRAGGGPWRRLGAGPASLSRLRDRVVEEWNRATHENRSHESRFRFQRPDGAIAWVLGQALPERGIHGKITGFTGAITDLTQHIEAENGLRASQAKLELRNEQLRRLAIKLGLATGTRALAHRKGPARRSRSAPGPRPPSARKADAGRGRRRHRCPSQGG